jgi:N utilization substance protein B
MRHRQKPRSIARELALLSLSQIKGNADKIDKQELVSFVLAAIRTLSSEAQEIIETAAAEVKRGNDRILECETRSSNFESGKAMLTEALSLTKTAINRLGTALELPQFVFLAQQHEVREYTVEILSAIVRRKEQIETTIEQALVGWQFNRLAQIDRDILKVAVAEMLFLDLPIKVAIDEAVELAKQYSDEDGYRFVNGVLRRVSDSLSMINK